MALANFTPSGYGTMAAIGASTSQALPGGGGATLVVTNLGPYPAFVLLGSSSVVVTPSTGMCVLANSSVALAVGTNTYIAAMSNGFPMGSSVLNLAQGT